MKRYVFVNSKAILVIQTNLIQNFYTIKYFFSQNNAYHVINPLSLFTFSIVIKC